MKLAAFGRKKKPLHVSISIFISVSVPLSAKMTIELIALLPSTCLKGVLEASISRDVRNIYISISIVIMIKVICAGEKFPIFNERNKLG